MDAGNELRNAFDISGDPQQGISKNMVIAFVIAIIILFALNELILKVILRDPAWKTAQDMQERKETQNTAVSQTYENKEYHFSFTHPPMTKRTEYTENDQMLNVAFGTENFKEIVAVREADAGTKLHFFGVLVKQNFTGDLPAYVTRQSDVLKNIARNANRNDTSEYVVKDVKIDGVSGYVIETVSTDMNQTSRRFFIPLSKTDVLLIIEINKKRPIDDILATFKIRQDL